MAVPDTDNGVLGHQRLLDWYERALKAVSSDEMSPVMAGVLSSNVAFVEYLIQQGYSPNEGTHKYGLPIQVAARTRQPEMVGLLVEAGALVSCKVVQDAVGSGSWESVSVLVDALVARAADFSVLQDELQALMIEAAKSGHTEIFETLLERLPITRETLTIPLHSESVVSVIFDRDAAPMLRVLLDRGLLELDQRIDMRSAGGASAMLIHLAAINVAPRCIELLCERGANLAEEHAGNPPLQLLLQPRAFSGSPDALLRAVKTLLAAGADPAQRDGAGRSVMQLVARNEEIKRVIRAHVAAAAIEATAEMDDLASVSTGKRALMGPL